MLSTALLLAASMVVGQADEPTKAHQELNAQVGWIIGDWEVNWVNGQGQQAKSTYIVDWTESEQFIQGKLTLRVGGKITMTATQILGWEYDKSQVKSWVFYSDGALSEGTVTKLEGDSFSIDSARIGPNGVEHSKQNFTKTDNGWSWEETTGGGLKLELTSVRK